MASFIEGLNNNLPQSAARLDWIGRTARALKQVSALALMVFIVPMTTGSVLAQTTNQPPSQQEQQEGPQGPPPPPPSQQEQQEQGPQGQPPQQNQAGFNNDQGAPQGPGEPQGEGSAQPLDPQQVDQLVAPIALYPDSLVAQVLAASTYPSEVVEADRWVQSKGNLPAEQLAAEANAQNWDPSIKALVAFPSVLAQMDKNIQWTTDLGNAYYNQPQDVMAAIQSMRGRAQASGTLHNTQQQDVTNDDGAIVIAPANPNVVYVPYYDPWAVYGAPIGIFPGYYYGPPAGVYFGAGLGLGFGIGIGIGVFGGWGWGYHSWGFNWRNHAVLYNRGNYYTHSRTVYNHGWGRPGGPPRNYAGTRGSYHGGGNFNRGGYHGGAANRGGNYNRGGGNYNHGAASNHGGGQPHSAGRPSGGHQGGHSGSGGHGGGGGHEGGGGGHGR